jgi:ribonuclease G
MAKGVLVINASGAETRVALVENETIHEYYLERKREKGIVGNIYKGRVVRVLPGMQAAFVDIGLEKAAFLYVGDVYGDPDFSEEFELTEGEHPSQVSEPPSEQEAEVEEAKVLAGGPSTPEEGAAAEAAAEAAADADAAAEPEEAPGASEGIAPADAAENTEPGTESAETPPALPLEQAVDAEAAAQAAEPAPAEPKADEARPEAGALSARLPEAAREAREAEPARPERPDRERPGRRDRDRDRGRGRGRDRGRGGRGRNNDEDREMPRRAKESKNIQDLLKEGQEVIVQVAKDPIGTKGARITSHISLPGRHLVFMPTVDHVGISRRIEKEGERRRLREIVDRMRPQGTGFIVRTVADGVEAPKLEGDIRFLIQMWNEIIRTKDKVAAPALLHPDLDLILRATRDLFTADIQKMVIDDRDEYERIRGFLGEQSPHLQTQLELYRGDEPIFDAYGIEQELKRAGQRKVWLKSGGYLIIDQAEALTAVDVNSGRYVGKKNLEETITKINVEAAREIVYQLRLRNIGGIIIIDFIDMDKPQNRDKVFKSLQEALGRDKAKTNVLKISELGLVEMTRKRVRESVTRMTNEPCDYCDGKGHLKSKITVAYEIFREIRRDASHYHEPVLVVNCHPEVAQVLQGAERDELRYLMDRFNKTIQVKSQQNYHQEQFDIYGRQERSEGRERGDREKEGGGREREKDGGGRERGERGDREKEGGGREGGRERGRDRNRGERGDRGERGERGERAERKPGGEREEKRE